MRCVIPTTVGFLGIAFIGCGPMEWPDWPRAAGAADGGAGGAGGAAPNTCKGACVPLKYAGWDGPYWLWYGPHGQGPKACPENVSTEQYRGYGDLVAPPVCEGCSCVPLPGLCELPTKLTADTMACNIPGGSSTDFSAPPGWAGSCDTSSPINAPNNIASLTVEPLTVVDQGCVPAVDNKAKAPEPAWATDAIVCAGGFKDEDDKKAGCPSVDRSECVPAPSVPIPPFTNWHVCIMKFGVTDLVNNDPYDCSLFPPFTEGREFFRNWIDHRSCTDCGGCGPMTGSSCSALVSVYEDNCCGCTNPGSPPVAWSLGVDSTKSACGSVLPPGVPLLSKELTQLEYNRGTCAPKGGKASGIAVPDRTENDNFGAVTLCCMPLH